MEAKVHFEKKKKKKRFSVTGCLKGSVASSGKAQEKLVLSLSSLLKMRKLRVEAVPFL